MSQSNYFSFLICNHPDHIDLYYNGIPLGVIRDKAFVPAQRKPINGEPRDIGIDDIVPPCPFDTMIELYHAIGDILMYPKLHEGKKYTDEKVG